MPFNRIHPRTTDTSDLSVHLHAAGHRHTPCNVLNLSEGGMLIDGGEFKVGELAGFELAGPDFRSAGLAEIAHRFAGRTGLKFVGWDAVGDRTRERIAARVSRQQVDIRAHTCPGSYLG